MELEKSQIFANVSAGIANLTACGVISREQAKELIKPFLPYDQRNYAKRETKGTIDKQAVTTKADVK